MAGWHFLFSCFPPSLSLLCFPGRINVHFQLWTWTKKTTRQWNNTGRDFCVAQQVLLVFLNIFLKSQSNLWFSRVPDGFTVIFYAGAVSVALGTVRISGCRFAGRSGFLLRCLESRSYHYNIQTVFFLHADAISIPLLTYLERKKKEKKLCITANTNIAVSLHASCSLLITITECASVSQRMGAAISPRRMPLVFRFSCRVCCFRLCGIFFRFIWVAHGHSGGLRLMMGE